MTARERFTEAERRQKAVESSRSYRARNLEMVRERARAKDRRARHGTGIHEWIAENLAVQAGDCYLCATPLGDRLVIDHDHTCCPDGSSCPACRRGVACDRCNRLIGQVGDDPELLRRIASALEAVLEPTRRRIAAKPVQLGLHDAEGTGS